MGKDELSLCLLFSQVAARRKNSSEFKVSLLRAIRSAIDRYLKQPLNNKPYMSIISKFESEQNTKCHLQTNDQRRQSICPFVHKNPTTSRAIAEAVYASGRQLLQTAWFCVTFYFSKRGRENQSKLTKEMQILRATSQGRRYHEFRLDCLISTKNHQGGLNYDNNHESHSIIFEVANSSCMLSHENPGKLRKPSQSYTIDVLFQRTREFLSNFGQRKTRFDIAILPLEKTRWRISKEHLDHIEGRQDSPDSLPNYYVYVRAKSVTVLSDHNCMVINRTHRLSRTTPGPQRAVKDRGPSAVYGARTRQGGGRGVHGLAPGEIFKYRVSEMLFPAF